MNLKRQVRVTQIKRIIGLLSIVIVAVSAIGFFSDGKISLPVVKEAPILNSLNGLPGQDGPVLVVKIDDTNPAHPQVGLKSADIVYVEQVEGGLTRLAAVFSSTIPDVIGPVRSARISDIELFSQYGKIAFAYSGAQKKLLPVIADANLVDVGAMRFGPSFYANDPNRSAPYAMMAQSKILLQEGLKRNPDIAISKNMGWGFDEVSPVNQKFSKVEISWPASRYSAIWSTVEKRWLLYFGDQPNLDESGYHLGPKNIVIQLVSITDSIYKDKVGGVTPFSETVGNGRCYLLRDAGSIPCLWNRPTAESGTSFTDLLGEPVSFAPGQSWIALTDKEPVFTGLQLQDATKSTNK
jgi:hypothetical protein